MAKTTCYRVQPIGMELAAHRSQTSNDNADRGVHVFGSVSELSRRTGKAAKLEVSCSYNDVNLIAMTHRFCACKEFVPPAIPMPAARPAACEDDQIMIEWLRMERDTHLTLREMHSQIANRLERLTAAARPDVREGDEEFITEGLVSLAGAVCTPEAGYIKDGGRRQFLNDVRTLRKQHDAMRLYKSPENGYPFSDEGFADIERQLSEASKLGDSSLLEMAALSIRRLRSTATATMEDSVVNNQRTVIVDDQGVRFGNFWISFDKLVGWDGICGPERDAYWKTSIFAKSLLEWLNTPSEQPAAPATASEVSSIEELKSRYLNDVTFHHFVKSIVADKVFDITHERIPGHVSQNEGDGWQLRPEFRPNDSQSATATVREAAEQFRDAVLHSRHQLEEPCLDGDQTNAVLSLFDDTIGAALMPPAAVAKNNRRVVFEFDERSYNAIDELKSRGMRFVEIALCNPETGERRSLLLPAAVEGAEPTREEKQA